MLKVFVSQVGCDAQTGNAVVVLNEPSCEKMLPIWIGLPEATAISWALQAIKTGRPSTHQLLFNVIETLNYTVEKVEITEIKNNAFLASLYVVEKSRQVDKHSCRKKKEPTSKIIDARPSDAIALAVMSSAPIYVSTAVFEQASVPARSEKEEARRAIHSADNALKKDENNNAEDDESFKKFLQELKASDFKLPGDQRGD